MQLVLLLALGSVAIPVIWRRCTDRWRTVLTAAVCLVALLCASLAWEMVQSGVGSMLYWGAAVVSTLCPLLAIVIRRRGSLAGGGFLIGTVIIAGALLAVADQRRRACAGAAVWVFSCGPQTMILVGLPLCTALLSMTLLRRRNATIVEEIAVAIFASYALLPVAIAMAFTWGHLVTGSGP